MPHTQLFVYRTTRGDLAPLHEWLDELRLLDQRAYAKCIAKIQDLQQLGHELRRPTADYLRDGIWELRTKHGRVNYRILYFFCGKNSACLSHGFTKEDVVPDQEIERAIERKNFVLAKRDQYTLAWEIKT